MSVFEAALLISSHRTQNPTLEDDELVSLLRAVRSDFFNLDYESGLLLHKMIPYIQANGQRELLFRSMIDVVIDRLPPIWVRLAPGGREKVLQGVSDRAAQCLKNAGLLISPPTEDVRLWWDTLASQARGERDAALLEQGREAERLSFEYEQRRLIALGITLQPKWVAVEDNSAGFDILSFDPAEPLPTNRLIEVKSSSRQPPVIHLTRNEWDTASTMKDKYLFHIWSFPRQTLATRTTAQIAQHIPVDQGSGTWESVEITINQP